MEMLAGAALVSGIGSTLAAAREYVRLDFKEEQHEV